MRILIIAPLTHPIAPPYAGGLEWFVGALADELVTRGHRVDLLAREGTLTMARHLSATSYWTLPSLLRTRPGAYDVIHNHSLHWAPQLLVRRRMITTLHVPPYRKLRNVIGLTRSWYPRRTYVSISQVMHRRWEGYCGLHTVIHNGIKIERWTLSENPEPRTAIWYGRIRAEKGLAEAIDACQQAGYRLRCAGPIEDRSYWKTLIEPQLSEEITYLGHLDHRQLDLEIGRAAVGIFSSLWEEPFGLTLLEMAACGTPIAGFASGAASEILDDRMGYLGETGDVGKLAENIPRAATLNRSECRKSVTERFAFSRMLSKYVRMFDSNE